MKWWCGTWYKHITGKATSNLGRGTYWSSRHSHFPLYSRRPIMALYNKSWNERHCELTREWSGGKTHVGFTIVQFRYIRDAQTLTEGPTGPGIPLSPYMQDRGNHQKQAHLEIKSSNKSYTFRGEVRTSKRQNRPTTKWCSQKQWDSPWNPSALPDAEGFHQVRLPGPVHLSPPEHGTAPTRPRRLN